MRILFLLIIITQTMLYPMSQARISFGLGGGMFALTACYTGIQYVRAENRIHAQGYIEEDESLLSSRFFSPYEIKAELEQARLLNQKKLNLEKEDPENRLHVVKYDLEESIAKIKKMLRQELTEKEKEELQDYCFKVKVEKDNRETLAEKIDRKLDKQISDAHKYFNPYKKEVLVSGCFLGTIFLLNGGYKYYFPAR